MGGLLSTSRPAARPAPETAEDDQNSHAGWRFYDSASNIWQQHPHPAARFNPPADTLPLPFKYYGQAFFKGFDFEKKV